MPLAAFPGGLEGQKPPGQDVSVSCTGDRWLADSSPLSNDLLPLPGPLLHSTPTSSHWARTSSQPRGPPSATQLPGQAAAVEAATGAKEATRRGLGWKWGWGIGLICCGPLT